MPGVPEPKCIVIGANGYIGRHLVRYLQSSGCSIQAVGTRPQPVIPGVTYTSADICDVRTLQSIDWNVDYVYMFAGLTGTHAGFSQFEQYVRVNEIGLLNVLACVKDSQHRPRIIFPSTRLVYRGSELPLVEDSPKHPKTVYAINKLACESILESHSNVFDIPFTVYRICVPYGNAVGSGYSYGLVGAFIKQAKEKARISLYGDGLLRRTLTHIEDICMHIIEATADERSVNGTFNIPGETFSLKDVAAIIAKRCGVGIEFLEWPQNDLKIESGHTVFDATKLQTLSGRKLGHRFDAWAQQAEWL